MADNKPRPIVTSDGGIVFVRTEEQKQILTLHGFDPEKVLILRNDDSQILFAARDRIYVIEKEVDTDGRAQNVRQDDY